MCSYVELQQLSIQGLYTFLWAELKTFSRLFPDHFFISQTQVAVRFFISQLKRERNKPWCIAYTMNHNAMQGIGDWALPQKLLDLNNLRRTATYYKVFCRLAKFSYIAKISASF